MHNLIKHPMTSLTLSSQPGPLDCSGAAAGMLVESLSGNVMVIAFDLGSLVMESASAMI